MRYSKKKKNDKKCPDIFQGQMPKSELLRKYDLLAFLEVSEAVG
jgi:hypothetical protein